MAKSVNCTVKTNNKKSFLSFEKNSIWTILGRDKSNSVESIRNDSFEDIVKKLSSKKKMLIKDDEGNTAAMYAALFGKLKLIEHIVSECIECMFMTNKKSENILHMAVKGGHLDCVCYISNQFKQLNNQTNNGQLTPLSLAVLSLNERISVEIQENCTNINQKDIQGNTVLHYAAYNSLSKLLKKLLKHPKIDPFIFNDNGYSPFHEAIRNGTNDVIKIFLELKNKSILTQLTKKHRDSIFIAAKHKKIKLVWELLKEIDIKWSSLHNSAEMGTIIHILVLQAEYELIISLIRKDHELVKMVNRRNETPKELASRLLKSPNNYDQETIKKLGDIENYLKTFENNYFKTHNIL